MHRILMVRLCVPGESYFGGSTSGAGDAKTSAAAAAESKSSAPLSSHYLLVPALRIAKLHLHQLQATRMPTAPFGAKPLSPSHRASR